MCTQCFLSMIFVGSIYKLFLFRKILFVIIIILLVVHASRVIGQLWFSVLKLWLDLHFSYCCFGSLKTVCLESWWSYTFKVYIQQVILIHSFTQRVLQLKRNTDISKFSKQPNNIMQIRAMMEKSRCCEVYTHRGWERLH